MSLNGGEIIVGMASGVGTVAITTTSVYIVRQLRKFSARIEAIIAAPAELVALRSVVAQNTTAISNLSSALDRLAKLAESR